MKIKIRALLFITVILTLVFSSCSGYKTGSDPFVCFSGEVNTGAKIKYRSLDASADVHTGKESAVISFISPAEFSGYCIFYENGKAELRYGEISVELTEEKSDVYRLMASVFSPDEEKITEIVPSDKSGSRITLGNGYVYFFDGKGTPVSVSGSFDGQPFDLVFENFGGTSGNGESDR